MIKLSIVTVVLSLLQLTAGEVSHAASANDMAATRQQGEQQTSDSQSAQTPASASETSSSWPSYQPAEKTVAGDFDLAFEIETEPLAESLLDSFSEYYSQLNGRAYNIQLDAARKWWEVPDAVGLFKLQMTDKEQAAFQRQHGHPLTMLAIAMSGVAIVVHPDNPIVKRGLTLAELDAIFSETRYRGHPEISLWGDLGLSGEWELRPIYKYRVTETNTLHDFFQQRVLKGGQFKSIATRESTSADVVDRIGGYEAQGSAAASEGNTDAIGFAYLEDVRNTVATVPVSAGDDEPAVFPTAENLEKTLYPLRQYTYLYLTQPPDAMLEGAQLEFVKLVFSQQGQEILKELNYTPAPKAAVLEKLRSIGVQRE